MTKKQIQRTDWKKEHRMVVVDRDHQQAMKQRTAEKLDDAYQRLDEQKRENTRLRQEAGDVSLAVLAVSQLADQILTAPERSTFIGEQLKHSREVLLGRLVEKLLQIPQPMPF